MKLVEGIYKDNCISDEWNEILAQTIVAYVKQRIDSNPNVKLRFLEIGAGTGETTNRDHYQNSYCFKIILTSTIYTDLSKAF